MSAGLIGLIISFALKGLVPTRPLGDPLPLVLSATQLTRGFLYFPWRPLVFHLLFLLFLALLTVIILRLISQRLPDKGEAARAGRIAALINVGIVALLAIDAFMVGFWYLASGLVSFLLTGFAAGLIANRWRQLSQQSNRSQLSDNP
jgi:hypothetical protein